MSQPAFRRGLWSPTSSHYPHPLCLSARSISYGLQAPCGHPPPAQLQLHVHMATKLRDGERGDRGQRWPSLILQPQWPWEGGHHRSAQPPWSSWKGTGGTSWLQSPARSPVGCSLTAMEVIDPELPRSRGQHGKAAGGLQLGHTKAVTRLLMATRNK